MTRTLTLTLTGPVVGEVGGARPYAHACRPGRVGDEIGEARYDPRRGGLDEPLYRTGGGGGGWFRGESVKRDIT